MGKLARGPIGVGVIYATQERHNSDMRILLAPNAFKGSLGALLDHNLVQLSNDL